MPIDSAKFKAIMGAFPAGVVVVATKDEQGKPHGATLNSMCSVSADPPMLLLCLDKNSRTLPIIRRQKKFLVNILSKGNHKVSKMFANKNKERFSGVEWETTQSGNVLLHKNIIAYAECTTRLEIELGDHFVIVGDVYAGSAPTAVDQPLLYYRRKYDIWPVLD